MAIASTPASLISAAPSAGVGQPLSEQAEGFRGQIVLAADKPPIRLRELGFVPGTSVCVVRRGPLGDPIELQLRGYRICLRRADLQAILVQSD